MIKRRKAEKDLTEALERLKRGCPTDRVLAERARAGRLKINPMTVAREARRSRTLIAAQNCAYPTVRELVLQAAEPKNQKNLKADVIHSLREQVLKLQSDLSQARTLLAAQRITIDALSRAN